MQFNFMPQKSKGNRREARLVDELPNGVPFRAGFFNILKKIKEKTQSSNSESSLPQNFRHFSGKSKTFEETNIKYLSNLRKNLTYQGTDQKGLQNNCGPMLPML